LKRQSRQKLREKTIGMVKIPQRTSWPTITWQRKKKKIIIKEMTISRDNKK